MKIIVLKFGGTSVGSIQRIKEVAKIIKSYSKKYKVSYDFENIKSAILTDGINTILKKQKKIVINPKEFKNLIDENSKGLKPEKIIDFFLN